MISQDKLTTSTCMDNTGVRSTSTQHAETKKPTSDANISKDFDHPESATESDSDTSHSDIGVRNIGTVTTSSSTILSASRVQEESSDESDLESRKKNLRTQLAPSFEFEKKKKKKRPSFLAVFMDSDPTLNVEAQDDGVEIALKSNIYEAVPETKIFSTTEKAKPPKKKKRSKNGFMGVLARKQENFSNEAIIQGVEVSLTSAGDVLSEEYKGTDKMEEEIISRQQNKKSKIKGGILGMFSPNKNLTERHKDKAAEGQEANNEGIEVALDKLKVTVADNDESDNEETQDEDNSSKPSSHQEADLGSGSTDDDSIDNSSCASGSSKSKTKPSFADLLKGYEDVESVAEDKRKEVQEGTLSLNDSMKSKDRPNGENVNEPSKSTIKSGDNTTSNREEKELGTNHDTLAEGDEKIMETNKTNPSLFGSLLGEKIADSTAAESPNNEPEPYEGKSANGEETAAAKTKSGSSKVNEEPQPCDKGHEESKGMNTKPGSGEASFFAMFFNGRAGGNSCDAGNQKTRTIDESDNEWTESTKQEPKAGENNKHGRNEFFETLFGGGKQKTADTEISEVLNEARKEIITPDEIVDHDSFDKYMNEVYGEAKSEDVSPNHYPYFDDNEGKEGKEDVCCFCAFSRGKKPITS